MAHVSSPDAPAARPSQKLLGAWYTPDRLVRHIVDEVVDPAFVGRAGGAPIRVLDPACGDGRFLRVASERIAALGGRCELVGVDVDPDAADRARNLAPSADVHGGDALARDWGSARFDLVVGNPPFLSQMASATTRGGSSDLGGGPYADVAVEFLSLAARLVEPAGGRVAFVLPQSVLSARDAADVRARYDERAHMIWSWWTGEQTFDAGVVTCAVAFEFGPLRPTDGRAGPVGETWSHVVTDRQRIPALPEIAGAGTLGDRARLNANFRDEYYGMVPAVGDHDEGPPLITSGLIDPGVCRWGERPVRFARRQFAAPRIDLGALDPKMVRWARDRLVPKVLVANQTRILEAVCDPSGSWLPAVPVVAAYPNDRDVARAWEIAAVLTSPVASAWAWHRSGGTGLSADAIRVGPVLLAGLPWPTASLDRAVGSLRAGDVRGCASAVLDAYGLGGRADLTRWWADGLHRVEARRR